MWRLRAPYYSTILPPRPRSHPGYLLSCKTTNESRQWWYQSRISKTRPATRRLETRGARIPGQNKTSSKIVKIRYQDYKPASPKSTNHKITIRLKIISDYRNTNLHLHRHRSTIQAVRLSSDNVLIICVHVQYYNDKIISCHLH